MGAPDSIWPLALAVGRRLRGADDRHRLVGFRRPRLGSGHSVDARIDSRLGSLARRRAREPGHPSPVQRRVPKSAEPPALVLTPRLLRRDARRGGVL